jgi:hypothetical protein
MTHRPEIGPDYSKGSPSSAGRFGSTELVGDVDVIRQYGKHRNLATEIAERTFPQPIANEVDIL